MVIAVPRKIELRYHEETDTYYAQLLSKQYYHLETSECQVRLLIEKLRKKKNPDLQGQIDALVRKKERLRKERNAAVLLYRLNKPDVPPYTQARPIYNLSGSIVNYTDRITYSNVLDMALSKQQENDCFDEGTGKETLYEQA